MSCVEMVKCASNGRDWIKRGDRVTLIFRWRGGGGRCLEMVMRERNVGLAEKSDGFR